jgi:hypothetical protein
VYRKEVKGPCVSDDNSNLELPLPETAPSSQPVPVIPETRPPSSPAPAVHHGPSDRKRETAALIVAFSGWLIPGLGHALLKMWGRALACFAAVAILVIVAAGMRGNIFSRNGEDAFSKLGYVADLGTGVFYWVAKSLEPDGADVSHANGDYGTRLLATAGVLNLLVALHAYEVTRGRKA